MPDSGYDFWKTDNDHYECQTKECKSCCKKDKAITEAQEFLTEIVKQLYTKEKLDLNIFEHCLDELCSILNVENNPGDIQIARPQRKEYQKLPEFLAYSLINQLQGANK